MGHMEEIMGRARAEYGYFHGYFHTVSPSVSVIKDDRWGGRDYHSLLEINIDCHHSFFFSKKHTCYTVEPSYIL
jgi:hypothetical protein